jgi:hypothetical protein
MFEDTLIITGILTIWAGITVVNIMLKYRTNLGERDRPLRILAVLLVGAIYMGFVFARSVWPEAQIALLVVALALMTVIQSGQRFVSSIWAWIERLKGLKQED